MIVPFTTTAGVISRGVSFGLGLKPNLSQPINNKITAHAIKNKLSL
jgi:hypothetical protein